ncbi:DUF302 domain-containing protein [Primorskyibacter sp. 2E107]|uniref:DUF302 domain-containing protein n=1 Tax=Primorskyibacter sp. 2E107 TaxID=3403458 RepID=UPI003AF45E63
MNHIFFAAALALTAGGVSAQDMITYDTGQSFDDVIFGLENAILDEGLVVDHISHTGEMLERTREAVGSDVVLFEQADIYSFCSAKVSREVMEADPMNIVFCPYHIFVLVSPEAPETTTIGFRTFPDGPMKAVQDMLDGIARNAIGLD